MTKAELRATYKAKRQALNFQQIERYSIAIANQIVRLDIWKCTYYHTFLSIRKQKEVDTEILMHVLQGKDKQIVVSQSNFKDFSLRHILLTDSTLLKENNFGIPEPQEGIEVPVDKIDVVFVPLFVSDFKGQRVGYGKGFYDRFLKNCRKDTLKIGLSFFEPVSLIPNIDSNDVPLDIVVTPDQVFNIHK
jgi:5-formyltetrahydrofolate cyclo-ligase